MIYKKTPCRKFTLIVGFITSLCLGSTVMRGRSEHLQAGMGVCFPDTWQKGGASVGILTQRWWCGLVYTTHPLPPVHIHPLSSFGSQSSSPASGPYRSHLCFWSSCVPCLRCLPFPRAIPLRDISGGSTGQTSEG